MQGDVAKPGRVANFPSLLSQPGLGFRSVRELTLTHDLSCHSGASCLAPLPTGVICIKISLRTIMQLEEIKKQKQQLYQIAPRHGISTIYVFGSVAREEIMAL
jgi:hypothetical protein